MAKILKLDKEEKLQQRAKVKHVKQPACESVGKLIKRLVLLLKVIYWAKKCPPGTIYWEYLNAVYDYKEYCDE